LNPVPAPSLSPEYITQVRNTSINEAFDQVSENIMGKFDIFANDSENTFLNVHNTHNFIGKN